MNDPVLDAVRRVLAGVAPEADLDALPPDASLRDELDLDSMDFLSFVIGLHKVLGVEIPEADYGKLSTLGGCVAYLEARVKRGS
ncbi:MAG: acyl carrier protein [Polyangiaceae bacterium]|nr:acyl carrier protein [Polyangiaceae bacterium]